MEPLGSLSDDVYGILHRDISDVPTFAALQLQEAEAPPEQEANSIARMAAALLHAAAASDVQQQQPEGPPEPGVVGEGSEDRCNVVFSLDERELGLPWPASPEPSERDVVDSGDSANVGSGSPSPQGTVAVWPWQLAMQQAGHGAEDAGASEPGGAAVPEEPPQPPPTTVSLPRSLSSDSLSELPDSAFGGKDATELTSRPSL
mmetsp:Transcript_101538/g.315816  ORF Transcript_101538/g.315816 Transcript_101538/m.315816 type:complete len:203 (-) Transcript_101538:90-698(-)